MYNWLDRTDLFKISKLVYGARVIVTIFCVQVKGTEFKCKRKCSEFVCQLTGTEAIYEGYRDSNLAVCSVKVYGLGEFFVTTDVVGRDKFGHFKSC